MFLLFSCDYKKEPKHLFILSGQSNMVGLNIQSFFIPLLETEFGKDRVLIVKDAHDGQPIARWLKNKNTSLIDLNGERTNLYDSLIDKVFKVINGNDLLSITFIWMQGETDAKYGLGDSYEKHLKQLYNQLSKDLNSEKINFIIGRLSDYDLENRNHPHWSKIRAIQMRLGESQPHYTWVNTDDLNDGLDWKGLLMTNNLHLSEEGYKVLGKRFTEAAILLLKENQLN